MPHTMTRAQAGAIRAVGLSAGALLLIGTGAVALTPAPDPASIKPGEVKVADLPAQQPPRQIFPDEIAEWISTAYRHDFPDEAEPAAQTQTPAPAPGATVRLVGVIGAGERAMAIVGVDDQQLLLAPGESGPDFRIEEIRADSIVMVRGGERSEVRLGERQGPLAGDIRPAGLLGGAGADAGGVADAAAMRATGRTMEADRLERTDYVASRRRELEQARAAARALEAGGSEDDAAGPGLAPGNGNRPNGANGANGVNGAAPGNQGPGAQSGGTVRRQGGGRAEGAGGDANN